MGDPGLAGVDGTDVTEFLSLLASHDPEVSLPTHPRVQPAARADHFRRAYAGGPVCVFSDGSMNGDAVG